MNWNNSYQKYKLINNMIDRIKERHLITLEALAKFKYLTVKQFV
jgi:hypothetical protein